MVHYCISNKKRLFLNFPAAIILVSFQKNNVLHLKGHLETFQDLCTSLLDFIEDFLKTEIIAEKYLMRVNNFSRRKILLLSNISWRLSQFTIGQHLGQTICALGSASGLNVGFLPSEYL